MADSQAALQKEAAAQKAYDDAKQALQQAQTDLTADHQKTTVDANTLKNAQDQFVKDNTAMAAAKRAMEAAEAEGGAAGKTAFKKAQNEYNAAAEASQREKVAMDEANAVLAADKQKEANDQKALATAENMSKAAAEKMADAQNAYNAADEDGEKQQVAMGEIKKALD